MCYDYECDESGNLTLALEPATPSWLLHLFGKDEFANVVLVAVDGKVGLDYAKDLDSLQILLIGSDAYSPVLSSRPGLGTCIVRGPNMYSGGFEPAIPTVNAERLKNLVALADLRRLDLSGNWIDEAGLESLKDLRQLRTLNLNDTKVAHPGVRKLEQARLGPINLQWLALNFTKVTDAEIAKLRQALPNCKITR